MNKQVKILENKKKGIVTSIESLTKDLNDRANVLLRGDPMYQALSTKLQMEQVRITDIDEFLKVVTAKPVKEKKEKKKDE